MTRKRTLQERTPVRSGPWACPICGRPFTALDLVMFEHEENYQCRHCWNRVGSSKPDDSPYRSNLKKVKLSRS